MTPIQQLTRLRTKHGHDSMIGARCSQGIEILQNLEKPVFAERSGLLRGSLMATLTEIAALQAGATEAPQVRREVALRNQQRGEA